ncbi:MAG TPA: putative metallopeptidase [Geobacteraceae bacterium]|nr:putative metallopeptidase [Geobacteraceae bacterium]
MSTFNLTRALEELVDDIVSRVGDFSHIDPTRILICVSSTRGGGVHGTFAKIHPLRFQGGGRTTKVQRGRKTYTCTMPTVMHRDIEMLYLIYFLVPRFLNLSLREKLITVFHELYHVSPLFDGDIRRFPGRNYAHGGSRKHYNSRMASLVDEYLGENEGPDFGFLDCDMDALRSRYRMIVARRFPAPKVRIQG